MNKKITFKITDYVERDLKWEEEECKKLDINFYYFQKRDASATELIEIFKDVDILLTNMASFTTEVMDGLKNVKVLLRHGTGYDKVDVATGLDVYEEEPLSPDHALLQMDNVILSPHFAWYSEESSWDIRYMIMDDVRAFLDGKLPKFVVNPEVLESSKLRFKIINGKIK